MTTPTPPELPGVPDAPGVPEASDAPRPAGTASLPPDGDERRLHPWSWLFVLLQQLRQFIIPLLVLVFLGRGDSYALWPLVGVAVLAAASVWRYFTYRYRVDDDHLVVHEGLLERQVRQIPFVRIHNVALHQTLLHRMFGVAEVRLESAGGTKPEAEMRVLRMEEALALERLIRTHGAVNADADPDALEGEGAAGDGDGRLLLSLPGAELVRLGLVSNRGMVVVAGAFAVSWQVLPDHMLSSVVRDAADRVFGYASGFADGMMARATAVALVVITAFALLRVLSVALALLQYHGFRLMLQGRRLTVERGLLTRLRTSAPRRRIQSWSLREGLLHRLLRRRSLYVDTVASADEGGEQGGLRELAPIATLEACDALVREVLPDMAWPPVGWRRLHPRAWQRLALPGLLFAGIATIAACGYFGPVGLLALAWAPWAIHAARQQGRRAGYALDARMVATRWGWWSRQWRFAEIDKLQALRLEQSPLDRWFGMATLSLDTAGARPTTLLRLRFMPEAEARKLHGRLAAELSRLPLRW